MNVFSPAVSVIASVTNPAPTLPEMTSLEQARGVVADQFQTIRQLLWRVAQLEKQIYSPSSERHLLDTLSKEQILLSLFHRRWRPPALKSSYR